MKSVYIGVSRNGQPDASPDNFRLVAGPFESIEAAQLHYDATVRYVRENFWREGADWWGYSIVGVEDYNQPGLLNQALGLHLPVIRDCIPDIPDP